jgi:Uma2 family endonuclease
MATHPVSAERRTAPAAKKPAARATVADPLFIRIPVSACTLAGFRAWTRSDDFPEQGRISFIGPEIFIDMSGERLESHVKVKGEINRVLGNLVVEADLGNFYPDGARVANEAADISNVPDAVFTSWESREADRVRPVPTAAGDDFAELEGAPDWVMEIISPSSVGKDAELLRERYHRAGIPEYWLIDARGDDIDFQILVRHPSGYDPVRRRGGWQKSPVFGRSFRLTRRRDRVGEWQYRLEVKPA